MFGHCDRKKWECRREAQISSVGWTKSESARSRANEWQEKGSCNNHTLDSAIRSCDLCALDREATRSRSISQDRNHHRQERSQSEVDHNRHPLDSIHCGLFSVCMDPTCGRATQATRKLLTRAGQPREHGSCICVFMDTMHSRVADCRSLLRLLHDHVGVAPICRRVSLHAALRAKTPNLPTRRAQQCTDRSNTSTAYCNTHAIFLTSLCDPSHFIPRERQY